jgi:hypothetical protein
VNFYAVLVWLHLLLAVAVTGYTLFWAIMGRALGQTVSTADSERLLGIAATARWPHVVVPWEMRLPLWLVGILLLVAAAVTGLLLGTPGNLASGIKVVLVIALLIGLRLLSRRPTPALGYGCLSLALAIVAVSTLLPR